MKNPFQDQVDCARYRAERDMLAQAMECVTDDIERTFLGFEGAEDAPAMRWARAFRAALGSLHAPVRDTTMSAYDLLPQDEREAIAWVREYGGLAEVKRKVAESMDQADDYIALRCSLAERAGDLYEMLDKSDDELIAMLDGRLMPPGMEWPRFEDSSLVEIGDEYECWCGDTEVVRSVTLRDGRSVLNESQPHSFVVSDGPFTAHGKRVKRPAPKVLDADGAEIRVGDDLYGCESGHGPFKVVETLEGSAEVKLKSYLDGSEFTTCAATFTHRAPVLAADGRPLREGETVWDKDSGDRLIVGAIEDGGHTIMCRYADLEDSAIPTHGSWSPCDLTHERPDSWQRLEEDVANASCPDVYCANHRIDASDTSYEWAMARDIVCRAKALAGVSE